MTDNDAVDVSVVIVTYNSGTDVRACLESLAPAAPGTSLQVIVVDNASCDDSVEQARASGLVDVLLPIEHNSGFAAACNTGAAAARGHYVLLVNPDAALEPGCIDALVAFAREHPDRTPLGGRCLDGTGRVDPRSCWGAPTLWSAFCFGAGLSRLARGNPRWDPESLGTWPRDTVAEVGVVTGFLLLVQRDVWNDLGGLDHRFFVYGEDVDFSLRARAAGRRPSITPDAVVRHDGGASSATHAAKLVLLYTGKATLMLKHWSPARARAGRLLLLLGVWIRKHRGPGATDYAQLWRSRETWAKGFPELEADVAVQSG